MQAGLLTTQVSQIGLFYLTKYLYEEKICYSELEKVFKNVKTIIKKKPETSFNELFMYLSNF
jgi:hypothetical protein